MEGHTLDEDGEHDEDACYQCALSREVKNDCRCGKCCHLLIEVELEDAEREPKIKEKGLPIYTPPELTRSGKRELSGYLLNVPENGHACAFLDRTTNLCTIHATRPLLCRLFDCDGDGKDQLIELGWLPPR
jgi:Fe-S-cluster containining protein